MINRAINAFFRRFFNAIGWNHPYGDFIFLMYFYASFYVILYILIVISENVRGK
jgi:hypothetical protein